MKLNRIRSLGAVALVALVLLLGPSAAQGATATSAYTGWAYPRSSGAATVGIWKWAPTGWSAAQIPAGAAVWASAWGEGWSWVWTNNAWHAVQSSTLETWGCTRSGATQSLRSITGLRSVPSAISGQQLASLPAGGSVTRQCTNDFPDATGAPTRWVQVNSGATAGYVPASQLAVSAGATVAVSSIAALKAALANNAVTEIVVANGTYVVPGATTQQANSLWIGAAYAGRTNPVVVRAETRGGVTLSGGGATYWTGIAFEEGARYQTWDGFNFANAEPTQSGAIVFGAYDNAPAHHITLRNITMKSTLRRVTNGDHAIYFSKSVGGVHDILIEDYRVEAPLSSALHFFHSENGTRNAWNVTVRRMTVLPGVNRAIALWDPTIRNITIEDSTISGAEIAVRYEEVHADANIVLRRVTTTNSSSAGFYSTAGANPVGLTKISSSFG